MYRKLKIFGIALLAVSLIGLGAFYVKTNAAETENEQSSYDQIYVPYEKQEMIAPVEIDYGNAIVFELGEEETLDLSVPMVDETHSYSAFHIEYVKTEKNEDVE